MKTLQIFSKPLAIGLAVLAYNFIFYSRGIPFPGTLGFVAFIATINLSTLILFSSKLLEKKRPKNQIYLSLALTTLAIWYSLNRASHTDQDILSLLALASSGFTFYSLAMPAQKLAALSELFMIPFRLGQQYITSIAQSLVGLVSGIQLFKNLILLHQSTPKDAKASQENMATLFRGIIISFGLIFFISNLLMSADPAFREFVYNLFDFDINFEIKGRLAWSALLTAFLLPASFIRFKRRYASSLNLPEHGKYSVEIGLALISVIGLLSIFLVVQFPYLFATVPETQLHQFGVQTYSEYVRQGFSELSKVSIIVYSVAALGYLVARQQKPVLGRINWTKWLTITLLLVTTLFIGSIFRRVYLYMADHGLTLARYYGALALIGLLGWNLSLMGRLIQPKLIGWRFAEVGIVCVTIFLPVFFSPEQLIISHFPPTVNKEIDYTYIARMNPEAVDGWIVAYEDSQAWIEANDELFQRSEVSGEEYRQLRYHHQTLFALVQNYHSLAYGHRMNEHADDIRSGWFDTNYANARAYHQFTQAIDIDQLKESTDFLHYFIHQRAQVTNGSHQLDRSTNSPLL